MGQTAKVLSAGYIAYKAGGPKDAYFSKEAQEELHTAQTVRLLKEVWVWAETVHIANRDIGAVIVLLTFGTSCLGYSQPLMASVIVGNAQMQAIYNATA